MIGLSLANIFYKRLYQRHVIEDLNIIKFGWYLFVKEIKIQILFQKEILICEYSTSFLIVLS